MRLKTWHLEGLVVWSALLGALVACGKSADWREWLAAVGVGLGFHHASVSSRLAEAEARRAIPSVECVRWLTRYWVGKEVAWVAYFLSTGAVSALVGCAIFIAHPLWRRWYRRRHPACVA